MREAEKLCDVIGIIHEGRLVALGTLEELRRNASHSARLEDIFLRLTDSSETLIAD